MFLDLLANNLPVAIAWIVAILMAFTVHEFSHALVGKLRGDRTAERQGRLTLNPLSHIDWVGFIPLLLLGFGWAKPVPFNPYNLKDPKWDSVKIALAGPGSNLVLAIVGAILLRIGAGLGWFAEPNLLFAFLLLTVILNLFLLFFNLIPVHPLDGSKLFFALFDKPQHAQIRHFMATRGPTVLLVLVLLSFLTPFDVFFFITGPAFATCDALAGDSCLMLMLAIFGA